MQIENLTAKIMRILVFTLCLLFACGQVAANQPVEITRSTQIMSDGTNRYYLHYVKRGETLYSLCRVYGISEEQLRRDNPSLSQGQPLVADTWLRILVVETPPATEPIATPVPPIHTLTEAEKAQLAAMNNAEEKVSALCTQCDSLAQHGMSLINIVLMLPLNANRPEAELYRSFRFLEVYEGALIALEKLRQQGLSVNLTVLDTEGVAINVLMQNPSLARADLIIGPVYQDKFRPLAEFARQRNIKIVSPLVVIDSSLYGYSNVFQVPVSPERLTQQLLTREKLDPEHSNIIFVVQRDGGEESRELRNTYRRLLPRADSTIHRNMPGRRDLTLLERQYQSRPHSPVVKNLSYRIGIQPRENHDIFLRIFSSNVENKVVVASQDEPFVTELLTNLWAFSDMYGSNITVYGASTWRRFENLDPRLFYDLKLHLAVPDHVDYGTDIVKEFIRTYRSRYRTEPSPFAFRGYDVMMYFASAMHRYGRDYDKCLHRLDVPLLQSNYSFAPIQSGGAHENRGVFLLRYTPWLDIVRYE